MKPPSNNWSSTDNAKGVLLFAQIFREAIDPETFESFRAYSLDTPARLAEVLFLASEVNKGKVTRATMEPASNEAIWSIKKDIAIKEDSKDVLQVLEPSVKSGAISDTMHALRLTHKSVAPNYRKNIEIEILACFDNPSSRIRLRQLTNLYCSHLLNIGFSRTYMRRLVEETFFTDDIQRTGRQSLASFFRNFEENRRKFRVFTRVSPAFGQHLKQLGYDIRNNHTQLDAIYQTYVSDNRVDTSNHRFLIVEVAESDGENAVSYVHRMLSSIKAVAYIVRPDLACTWDTSMFVHPSRAQRGAVCTENEFTLQRYVPAASSSRTIKAARTFTRRILNYFDRGSTERILSAINTAALAHSSSSMENQMISLWSSIEVLISSPLHGETRILHYINNIKPLICLKHSRRKTVYVYDQLARYYKRGFHKIINEETILGDVDQHTKFAGILYLPDNSHLRDKLLALCTDNPLALHRMFILHRDYSSTKKLLKLANDHEQRVEWQIHRIYRARNQLVHNGRMPSYIESLIINMDEYFRYAIGTVVGKASKSGGRNHIDQVVFDVAAEYKMRLRQLERLTAVQEKSRAPENEKYVFTPETLVKFFR